MKIIIIGQIVFSEKIKKFFLENGIYAEAYNYADIAKISFYDYYKLIKNADIIYFFNGTAINKLRRLFLIRFLLRKQVIVHFIGTDALNFLNHNHIKKPSWILSLLLCNKVFGISKNIVQELSPYLKIKYIPICFDKLKYPLISYPKEFSALIYLPPTNPDFYGFQIIKKIIKKNDDINFIILGNNDKRLSIFKNVMFKKIDYNMNMNKIYDQATVLIRLTKHDGLSNMVLESLARGKHVIWTQPFKYCHHVLREVKDVQEKIEKIKKLPTNREAMPWIQKNYNSLKLLNQLKHEIIN